MDGACRVRVRGCDSLLAGVDGRRLFRVDRRRLDDSLVRLSFLLVCLLLHDADLFADPPELGRYLLLYETEAHGQDGHAEEHVDGRPDHLPLVAGVLEVGRAGYNVAEADRRDGDETKVGRLQRVPPFPYPEQQRPHEYVAGDYRHGDGEWHADLAPVFVFVVLVIVDDQRAFRVGCVAALLRFVGVLPCLGTATATTGGG